MFNFMQASLECVVCGVRGNLLYCDKCHKSYHLQCLDKLVKVLLIFTRRKIVFCKQCLVNDVTFNVFLLM